jgi:hypothetical protein
LRETVEEIVEIVKKQFCERKVYKHDDGNDRNGKTYQRPTQAARSVSI